MTFLPGPDSVRAAGILLTTGQLIFIQLRGYGASNPRTWACPGGKLEPGESPWQAASREFREECGTRAPPGSVIGEWTFERPNLLFTTFLVLVHPRTPQNMVVHPDEDEAAALRWVTRTELQRMTPHLHPGFAEYLAAVDPFVDLTAGVT